MVIKRQISFKLVVFYSFLIIIVMYTVINILLNTFFITETMEKNIIEKNLLQAESIIEVFDAYVDSVEGVYSDVVINIYEHGDTYLNYNEGVYFFYELPKKNISNITIIKGVNIFDLNSMTYLEDDNKSRLTEYPNWVKYIRKTDSKGFILSNNENNTELKFVSAIKSENAGEIYISLDINKEILEKLVIQKPYIENTLQLMVNKNNDIILGDYALDKNKIFSNHKIKDNVIIEGKNYTVFSKQSEIKPYKYIQLVPSSKLFASVKLRNTAIMITCIIMLIIGSILSYFISNTLTRPIINLASFLNKQKGIEGNKMEYIERGKIINKEYSLLYNSINNMLNRIDRQVKDIRKINDLKENEEIKNIRSAVNPHFQCNVLNSIIWMLEDGKTNESIDALSSLGTYYRNALEISNDFAYIEDEINNIKNYFNLLKMTMNNSVKLNIIYDDDIKFLEIPTLMMQPIAENAIIHGFKDVKDNKELTIQIKVIDKGIYISFEDNGKGIDKEKLDEINNNLKESDNYNSSFGMWNVNKRIKLLYGNDYGVNIESRVEQYTIVTIKMKVM